jgi:hypothetical protein
VQTSWPLGFAALVGTSRSRSHGQSRGSLTPELVSQDCITFIQADPSPAHASRAAIAFLYLGAVGVITAIIPNALFARIVEPTAWSYIFWVTPAALFGPLAASYVLPTAAVCDVERVEHSTTIGSVLSFLAAGCPVCNKLVVLALGRSGAITYFEPVEPWLGGLSVILLGYALMGSVRTRSQFARFVLTQSRRFSRRS